MNDERIKVVCAHCDAVNRVERKRVSDRPRCGSCKELLFSGAPIALSAVKFDRHVEQGDLPVVVDFWAPWCQPCQMMAPAFERAAAEIEPRARFAKVNTDEEPALAARFAIRGIPTIVIYKNGNEVARRSGAHDFHTLARWIREYV